MIIMIFGWRCNLDSFYTLVCRLVAWFVDCLVKAFVGLNIKSCFWKFWQLQINFKFPLCWITLISIKDYFSLALPLSCSFSDERKIWFYPSYSSNSLSWQNEPGLDLPDSRLGAVLAGRGGGHCLGPLLPGLEEQEERGEVCKTLPAIIMQAHAGPAFLA